MRESQISIQEARTNDPETRNSLSARQLECLYWVMQGKSSRDIGVIIGVSHRIVERHIFRACERLGVRTRLQAVIQARSLGLLSDAGRDRNLNTAKRI